MLGNHLSFSIHLCNFLHRAHATTATRQIKWLRMNNTDGWVWRSVSRQVRIWLSGHSWRWSLWQTWVW